MGPVEKFDPRPADLMERPAFDVQIEAQAQRRQAMISRCPYVVEAPFDGFGAGTLSRLLSAFKSIRRSTASDAHFEVDDLGLRFYFSQEDAAMIQQGAVNGQR